MRGHEGHRTEAESYDKLAKTGILSFEICYDCGVQTMKLIKPVERLRMMIKYNGRMTTIDAVPHQEEVPSTIIKVDAVEVPPVDRSQRCTVGEAVAPGVPNTEAKPGGQQKGYVILCDEERAKGFVRPVRRTYVHNKCGTTTTMGQKLAETYARDPEFYSGTFCCSCGGHFPVGAEGEFIWDDGSGAKVGT